MVTVRLRSALVLLSAALALAGCRQRSGPAEVAQQAAITAAWVRLPAVPGRPAAAYFTLAGGPTADRLVAVTSPAAGRAELHETMAGEHAMATMAPLAGVDVPAGGTIVFAPAGRHVMLFGLAPTVVAGGELPLDFAFASGRRLSAPARIRAAGDGG